MKSILRATGMLSVSGAVTVAAGMASAKVWALLVGTQGVGYMALLQSLLGMATLVAGVGVSVGLVRFGAKAIADGDSVTLAEVIQGAWLLTLIAGLVSLPVLLLLRGPISAMAFGSTRYQGSVAILWVALALGMITGVQTGILNAHHRVVVLAKNAILTAAFGAVVEIPFIWIWKSPGVPYAMVAAAATGCAIATVLTRNELPHAHRRLDYRRVHGQILRLLRYGGSYTAGMAAGAGVLLAMPILVLHVAGSSEVGAYRAAAAVGATYLGFLLSAFAQDYFPRVSAVVNRPDELVRLVNDQHRLVLLISLPVILAAMALCPFIVPILYSPAFSPAGALLQWLLAGDVFRLTSWVLSFVVLARCGGGVYFLTELFGGAGMAIFSLVAMTHFGLAGAGMGYCLAYAMYLGVVWVALRAHIDIRLARSNVILLGAGIAAVAAGRVVAFEVAPNVAAALLLVLATCFGLYSLRTIVRETVSSDQLVAAPVGSG